MLHICSVPFCQFLAVCYYSHFDPVEQRSDVSLTFRFTDGNCVSGLWQFVLCRASARRWQKPHPGVSQLHFITALQKMQVFWNVLQFDTSILEITFLWIQSETVFLFSESVNILVAHCFAGLHPAEVWDSFYIQGGVGFFFFKIRQSYEKA